MIRPILQSEKDSFQMMENLTIADEGFMGGWCGCYSITMLREHSYEGS